MSKKPRLTRAEKAQLSAALAEANSQRYDQHKANEAKWASDHEREPTFQGWCTCAYIHIVLDAYRPLCGTCRKRLDPRKGQCLGWKAES